MRDTGEQRLEVHCTTCEGTGAALRTHLRTLQGCAQVVSASICRDVGTYEAIVNTKRVTPELIQGICYGTLSAHANDRCANSLDTIKVYSVSWSAD
jgi:hypothetical protein